MQIRQVGRLFGSALDRSCRGNCNLSPWKEMLELEPQLELQVWRWKRYYRLEMQKQMQKQMGTHRPPALMGRLSPGCRPALLLHPQEAVSHAVAAIRRRGCSRRRHLILTAFSNDGGGSGAGRSRRNERSKRSRSSRSSNDSMGTRWKPSCWLRLDDMPQLDGMPQLEDMPQMIGTCSRTVHWS